MQEEGRDIPARWNGSSFEPQYAAQEWCQKSLAPFEHVTLTVYQARTQRSHNHQFAWLTDAIENMPERYQSEPWAQSEEHLRKYALIRTGFFDCQTIAVGSEDEAERWAPVLQQIDSYSIVVSTGDVVYRYTAQSQKMKVMGKEKFQRSKTAILNFVAGLIGVHPEELSKMGTNRRKRT